MGLAIFLFGGPSSPGFVLDLRFIHEGLSLPLLGPVGPIFGDVLINPRGRLCRRTAIFFKISFLDWTWISGLQLLAPLSGTHLRAWNPGSPLGFRDFLSFGKISPLPIQVQEPMGLDIRPGCGTSLYDLYGLACLCPGLVCCLILGAASTSRSPARFYAGINSGPYTLWFCRLSNGFWPAYFRRSFLE